jgi:hypothetical protein
MKKVIILLGSSLILAGCLQSTYVPEEIAYEWSGCHTVEQNPGPDGSEAILPFGFKMLVGGYTFFKQVSDDGTVSPITTGKPCY